MLPVHGTASRPKSRVEATNQAVVAVGLAQEADRASFHGARSQLFLGKRCDENNRHIVAIRDQAFLQLDPAQSRHMQVGDQTRCIVQSLGLEKLFGGSKRGNVVTQGTTRPFVAWRTARSSSTIDIIGIFDNPCPMAVRKLGR